MVRNKLCCGLMVGSILLLAGCDVIENRYQTYIEEKAEITTVQETTTEAAVDLRLVPEMSQVEFALQNLESITLGNELYRLNQRLTHTQSAFELSVEQMVVYEASASDATLGLSSNGGALVVLEMAITNTSNQTFYFPIEELRLTYQDAPVSCYASTTLYPLESGNLYEILLANNKGEMAPGATVNGYLVYAVSAEDIAKMKQQQSFNLTVVPPTISSDEIVGISSNALGSELPFYLPLQDEVLRELLANEQYVQDRITAEWWGTKVLLANARLNEKFIDQQVTFTLKHIEVSDLVLREPYKEYFKYFPNGQVIVSVEFEIENQSSQPLLPIDSFVNLMINGDNIQSDYVLINQLYGQRLEPGEKTTVIKSFALDKLTYQQNWQGKEMQLSIQLSSAVETTPTTVETTTSEGQVEEFVTSSEEATIDETVQYIANFVWNPELIQYIDANLNIVDELIETEDSVTTTEVQ